MLYQITVLFILSLPVLYYPALNGKVLVLGHRGARALYPENTMPAFQHALDVGVDVIELDLGVSKDNVLVVYHDQKINNTICSHPKIKINSDIYLRNLNLEQIQEFDCGSRKNPRFPNQQTVPGAKIPTLEEVFKWISKQTSERAKTIEFNIETKIVPGQPEKTAPPQIFANLLIKMINKYKMQNRVWVQSFDARTLEAVKAAEPSIRISMLIGFNYFDHTLLLKNLDAQAISPYWSWIDEDAVKNIQRYGGKVFPWTANNEEQWEQLIKMGVDGIITDNPKALISYILKGSKKKISRLKFQDDLN